MARHHIRHAPYRRLPRNQTKKKTTHFSYSVCLTWVQRVASKPHSFCKCREHVRTQTAYYKRNDPVAQQDMVMRSTITTPRANCSWRSWDDAGKNAPKIEQSGRVTKVMKPFFGVMIFATAHAISSTRHNHNEHSKKFAPVAMHTVVKLHLPSNDLQL